MDRRKFMLSSAILPVVGLGGCNMAEIQHANLSQSELEDRVKAASAAFYFAYPIYEYAHLAQVSTRAVEGRQGRLNSIGHRKTLTDHTARGVTMPNNDTLFSSGFMDLSAGPMQVYVPESLDRYYSLTFMDVMTDNVACLGTRASGGREGLYWICGPIWNGDVPDGVSLIRMTTNDAWAVGRILVTGPDDAEAAHALQRQITVEPVASENLARPYIAKAPKEFDAKTFLDVVNEMIRRTPEPSGELARWLRFASVGLGSDGPVSSDLLAVWESVIQSGLAELKHIFEFSEGEIEGWTYPVDGVGNFGEQDLLRAAIALGGLGALEQSEAMYFMARSDSNGETLMGQYAYRWRLPSEGVPVDGFWSLTMYEADDQGRFFLVDNPIGRYSIGDRSSDFVRNADGSVDILIQRDAPAGDMTRNWLPAPSGEMRLAFRAYIPGEPIQNGRWRAPPVRRVS